MRAGTSALIALLGIAVAGTILGSSAYGGWPRGRTAPDSVVVQLRSRAVVLSAASTSQFRVALRASPLPALHALAFTTRPTTAAERRALEARGVALQSPLGSGVYLARIARTFESDSLVSYLAGLEPRDRVHPWIWSGEVERFTWRATGADSTRRPVNYLLTADSALKVLITFHRDVSDTAITRILASTTERRRVGSHAWRAIIERRNVATLAANDEVRWMAAGPVPVSIDNDHTRDVTGVDLVQDFSLPTGHPLGLGGRNVRVGVFDEGIDETHPDFSHFATGYFGVAIGTRAVVTDPAVSWHGTLVAGIAVGNGYQSSKTDSRGDPNGGTSRQWRGMAPEARLIEVFLGSIADAGYGPGAWIPDLIRTANVVRERIVTDAMDVSNHSYGLDALHDYGAMAAQRDSMLHGSADAAGLAIPARGQVYSSGNNGGVAADFSIFSEATVSNSGYFSLNKQSKNGIIVGNWNVGASRIATSSSLGPTTDGRITPDLVAPGTSIKSTAYWDPAVPFVSGRCPTDLSASPLRRNFYATECGSSLSAPVVTGIAALVLEQMGKSSNATASNPPLPSSLRAILVHTAVDQVADYGFSNIDGPVKAYAGPDFATGWGLVSATGAVDVVAKRLYRESTIDATCSVRTYEFDVVETVAGELPSVRVTLAWDDPAADPWTPSASPRLVNDLDLVLIDPAGGLHYPWQRNQVIKNTGGTVLAPDEQTCGRTDLVVERRLVSPGPVAIADLDAASTGVGPDHLNNIEQVFVSAGAPGKWKAVVTGMNVPAGPQRFSIVGVPGIAFLEFEPFNVCNKFPAFCQRRLFNMCDRAPVLCARPMIIPMAAQGPIIEFRSMTDRVILPVRQLCVAMNVRGRCDADSTNTGYDFELLNMPVPLGVELMDGTGRLVAGSVAAARSARFRLTPERRGDYFIYLTPSDAVRPGVSYRLPLTVRPTRP
jgi:hypothetical protein